MNTENKLDILNENIDIWKNSNLEQRRYLVKMMCDHGRMIIDDTYYILGSSDRCDLESD